LCGIIGYTGFRNANNVLVDCLKRLEYRGYDSAGIATLADQRIEIKKDTGEIDEINKKLNFEDMEGTSGIGHCLHPETLICTSDGKLCKISNLQEQKVLSIKFNEAKIENRKQRLTKHKSPDYLFKIKTPFSEFKATGAHRVFVKDGGEVKEKKINELQGNELIAAARRIPHPFKTIKHFHNPRVETPNEKNHLSGEKPKVNHQKTEDNADIRTGQRRKTLKRRPEDNHSNRGFTPSFPSESTCELLQIIGYLIGKNSFQKDLRIRFKDEEVLEKYTLLFKTVFNITGKIRENRFILDVNNEYLINWLKGNVPELFNTKNEEIPGFIFQAPKEQVSSFLRGIFDAAGNTCLKALGIDLCVANEFVARKIQFLLLKFGILTSFHNEKQACLHVNDEKSIGRFKEHIGFTSKKEKKKLNELLHQDFNRNLVPPYKTPPLHDLNEFKRTGCPTILAKISEKPWMKWEKIFFENNTDIIWTGFDVEKIKSDVEYVYDLEVEHNHNFIGNLVVQHNSRWATHGGVTQANAHPHTDCKGDVAIVHNGIIENYRELKEELVEKGHMFTSETDTEVVAHLIEENRKNHQDLEHAVSSAVKRVKGSYALVVISKDEPDKLVGVKKESPLVIGLGDNENFIASDVPAFLKFTNRVIYLDDDEICTITKSSIKIYDKNMREIEKKEKLIKWDIKDAEKSGFPHFMLKEIYDQPGSIHQVLRGRVSEIHRTIEFNHEVENLLDEKIGSIHIVACGTSFYAGLVGKYIIEKLTGIPTHVELASEYRYFGTRNADSLVIGISQSGETADTLAAVKEAKKSGCTTLAITNVIGSTITRISDATIIMQSGPEIGVAATKTFTSQIIILLLIALKIATRGGKIGADELYKYIIQLRQLPKKIRHILDKSDEILNIARQIKDAESVFFIGRGINYPLSLEGALKLKEISYIHAEGFAAGELKHGPFALLTRETPVLAIITMDSTYDKMMSNIDEVKARGSPVIAIADEKDTEIEKHADYVIRFPSNTNPLNCLTITVILQLLAYHVANLNGCPIDKPRNLAKSVTVE
jgi:glucosamine--fructose-6-phosphate aminotransferase (isomerizing)